MADLLFEILSEEIPARLQKRGLAALSDLVAHGLRQAGLAFSSLEGWVTPRRLTLAVRGLPLTQPERIEERKGPRVGAPQEAIRGFLAASGLSSLDEAEKRDTGKGEAWFAVKRIAGGSTADLLPCVLVDAMLALSWPKSMRWRDGRMVWVRPLRALTGLFDGKPLSGGLHIGVNRPQGRLTGYDAGTVESGDLNYFPFGGQVVGHRFCAPQPVGVTGIDDYQSKLLQRFVMLDPALRRQTILSQAEELARSVGGALVEDADLVDEVTGLVEWPVALLGGIDPPFMTLPAEVLRTSLRAHQKYFCVRGQDGSLMPYFVLIANNPVCDDAKAIVAGNERVLRARLSDARFFWQCDLQTPLEEMAGRLQALIFHAKLGTMAQKTRRVAILAGRIASSIGADSALAGRAADLAKADLASATVAEFPELQGIVGRYYALHGGEDPQVAKAIADHYAPQGPYDRCPDAPVSLALALADKLDTLVGFFAIDEKPTGSKDPFALRRAAIGVVRLILENNAPVRLRALSFSALDGYGDLGGEGKGRIVDAVLGFLIDRLNVQLRENGVRHDLVQAVSGVALEGDFVGVRRRIDALAAFLASEAGLDLLAACRRAGNILRIEEKKDGRSFDDPVEPGLLTMPQERALALALDEVETALQAALDRLDDRCAMVRFSALRQPIDVFFTDVTVNASDPALRCNRLRLLHRVRAIFSRIADFSAIEG